MAAPTSWSQKGPVQQQQPRLSKSWQRVAARGSVIIVLLLSILSLYNSHHEGLGRQRLQTLWRHPSELSWSDLGMGASMRRYVSFDLESPVTESLSSDSRCEPGYIFFTPGGHSPMILDSQGDLVWTAQSSAATQNFRVQRYRQQDYLTYWAGKPFGPGYYYMVKRLFLFFSFLSFFHGDVAPLLTLDSWTRATTNAMLSPQSATSTAIRTISPSPVVTQR